MCKNSEIKKNSKNQILKMARKLCKMPYKRNCDKIQIEIFFNNSKVEKQSKEN